METTDFTDIGIRTEFDEIAAAVVTDGLPGVADDEYLTRGGDSPDIVDTYWGDEDNTMLPSRGEQYEHASDNGDYFDEDTADIPLPGSGGGGDVPPDDPNDNYGASGESEFPGPDDEYYMDQARQLFGEAPFALPSVYPPHANEDPAAAAEAYAIKRSAHDQVLRSVAHGLWARDQAGAAADYISETAETPSDALAAETPVQGTAALNETAEPLGDPHYDHRLPLPADDPYLPNAITRAFAGAPAGEDIRATLARAETLARQARRADKLWQTDPLTGPLGGSRALDPATPMRIGAGSALDIMVDAKIRDRDKREQVEPVATESDIDADPAKYLTPSELVAYYKNQLDAAVIAPGITAQEIRYLSEKLEEAGYAVAAEHGIDAPGKQ